MARLYTLRNYASIATHYSITAGVAVATYMMGQPWTMVVGAAFAVGITTGSLKIGKVLEGDLVEHPKVHLHSPKLGQMVEQLYKVSGLSSDKFPVYDFKVRPTKGERPINTIVRIALGGIANTPNAAASHWDKPIIMISEPLLELLKDDEEYAVLAHEFAHAAARHGHMTLPQRVIGTAARVSNRLVTFVAGFSSGFANFAYAVISAAVAGTILNKLHPKRELLSKKDDDLSLREIFEKKNAKRLTDKFGMVASLGAFYYFVPAYLPIWAAAKTINVASSLAEKTFSRSDEYQADRGAVVLGANPLSLVTSLRRITLLRDRSLKAALGDEPMPEAGSLTKWWKQVNSTHPKLESRIERLVDLARDQGRSEDEIKQAVSGELDISKGHDIPYSTLKLMASRFV